MNHVLKAKLLIAIDENPDDQTNEDLYSYVWLVEQLLQELRKRVLERRIAAEHPTITTLQLSVPLASLETRKLDK